MIRNAWPYLAMVLLISAWLLSRWQSGNGDWERHPHQPSVHGGTLISLARDRYHVEVVETRDGMLRLFTYGADETRVLPVDSQTLTAYARVEGESTSFEVPLQPDPQPGDNPGTTSRFSGPLPAALAGRTLAITIPALHIGGERLRVAWTSSPQHDPAMPDGAPSSELAELYLTPAGKYTEADIAANGQVTAAQRYASFQAKHDTNPQPGDLICPVTGTKASRKCSWIIDGQTYYFCCPPCIDETVRLARESPHELRSASEYVRR